MFAASISLSLYLSISASASPNLIPNGDFEMGLDPWKTYGDSAVIQTLVLDQGRESGKSAKLNCSSFDGSNPSSHAMIAQAGAFPLKKDQWYRFSCWAKSQGLPGGQVSVALSDTKVWDNAGLSMALTPGGEWRRFETLFQANRDITNNGRLQFWYGETGTLWLDEVAIEETSEPHPVFTNRLPLSTSRNKIPNASFEAGSDGWSSLGEHVGWGNLTGLFGIVQKGQAADGDHCLKIELGPGKTITTYFDYFDPVAVEQKSPLAANLGWIPVEKGKKYTLSAFLRADQAGVPAQLKMVMGRPMAWSFSHEESVVLTKEWKRYSTSFEAMTSDLHVAVGPHLSGSTHDEATVWVDAVQLEEGLTAGVFEIGNSKLEIHSSNLQRAVISAPTSNF